jgi:hypothetical protein
MRQFGEYIRNSGCRVAAILVGTVRRWWGKEEGRGFIIGDLLNPKKDHEAPLRRVALGRIMTLGLQLLY